MATYDLASTSVIVENLIAGDIIDCSYSGSKKEIILPPGTYQLEVWGAEGGYRSSTSYSGKGGYSKGTLTLTEENTTLYLYAGGHPGHGTTNSSAVRSGGFNGGGYRYGYYGGGGGSDIRINTDSLYARVIVAGGGGSDGATNKTGLYGGGTSGGTATQNFGSYGYGGTQTGHSTTVTMPSSQPTTNGSSNYPGGFGFGGFGIYSSSGYAGAGGGGWYGGCGSRPDSSGDDDRGGGGGSGYVYTSSTASNYPSGCLLNSSYYLADASTTAGSSSFTGPTGTSETGHSGHGYCRITIIEIIHPIKEGFYVKVPNECQEVEYITTSGSQYFKTGYIPNNTTRVKMTCSVGSSGTSSTFAFFGARTATTTNTYSLFHMSNTSFRSDYGTAQTTATLTMGTGKLGVDKNENACTIGSVTATSAASTFNCEYELYIFALNTAGAVNNYFIGNFYSCQIYDNDVLVRDYIPVYNTIYQEYGLYDKINNKYEKYQGTGVAPTGAAVSSTSTLYHAEGEWKYAPTAYLKVDGAWKTMSQVKIPQPYYRCAYIESTGTQYIDTGFKPNQNTRVIIDMDAEKASTDGTAVFGVRTAFQNTAFSMWVMESNILMSEYANTYVQNTSLSNSELLSRYIIDKNKNIVTAKSATITHTAATFSCSYNMLLCAINDGGVAHSNKFIGKIYSCKIYDNDILVRDYIPVQLISGEYGLWDRVENKFYGNQGTGVFFGVRLYD